MPALKKPRPQRETGKEKILKQLGFYPALAIATFYGLALALYDITQSADYGNDLAYMGVAAALGFLRPKSGLVSAIVLTLCLYGVHIVALGCGLRQPYVERDYESALACLANLIPTFAGAIIGGAIGWVSRRAYSSCRLSTGSPRR